MKISSAVSWLLLSAMSSSSSSLCFVNLKGLSLIHISCFNRQFNHSTMFDFVHFFKTRLVSNFSISIDIDIYITPCTFQLALVTSYNLKNHSYQLSSKNSVSNCDATMRFVDNVESSNCTADRPYMHVFTHKKLCVPSR